MGYDKGSRAYLVNIAEIGKIFKYRMVIFARKGMEQQTQTDCPLGDDDFMPLRRNINPDIWSVSDVDKSEKGPDELAEGPEAMIEVNPTSQPPDESVRRSNRERKPLAYLRDFVTDMEGDDQVLTSVDYCYKFSAFPQTYQEAKESAESRNWEAAMN